MNVITYAVGVGSEIETSNLAHFAGDASRVVRVEDYRKLESILTTLDNAVCSIPTPVNLGDDSTLTLEG
jgi:hypothetical protein